MPSAPLDVLQVGSYEASIVPSIADFSRLDQRFRLPSAIWQELPNYRDYAFAVVKLRAGESHTHPMVQKFTSRFTDKIFFPTLHTHAEKVDANAEFDHQPFAQGFNAPPEKWYEAVRPVAEVIDFKRALQSESLADIVGREQALLRSFIRGRQINQDTFAAIHSDQAA